MSETHISAASEQSAQPNGGPVSGDTAPVQQAPVLVKPTGPMTYKIVKGSNALPSWLMAWMD